MTEQQKIKDTPALQLVNIQIGVLDLAKFKDIVDNVDFMIIIQRG